jgi:hypothetical protein
MPTLLRSPLACLLLLACGAPPPGPDAVAPADRVTPASTPATTAPEAPATAARDAPTHREPGPPFGLSLPGTTKAAVFALHPACEAAFDADTDTCRFHGSIGDFAGPPLCEDGCTWWTYTFGGNALLRVDLERSHVDVDAEGFARFAAEAELVAGILERDLGPAKRIEDGLWENVESSTLNQQITLFSRSWSRDGVRTAWDVSGVTGHHPQAILRVTRETDGLEPDVLPDPPAIRWDPSGDNLVLSGLNMSGFNAYEDGGSLRYDLTQRTFTPYPAADTEPARPAPDPAAMHVLIRSADAARAAKESGFPDTVQTRGAWVGEQTWLTCDSVDYTDLAACALVEYGPNAPLVRTLSGVPELTATIDIQVEPGGWVIVRRAPEGHLFVDVYRLDLEARTLKRAFEMPSLYDTGPLDVTVAGDGLRLWLVTPCLLATPTEGHPCMDDAEGMPLYETDAPWRWFEWSAAAPRLRLLRADLPAGAVPHPGGGELAWATQEQLCIGDPAPSGDARCEPIPTPAAQ